MKSMGKTNWKYVMSSFRSVKNKETNYVQIDGYAHSAAQSRFMYFILENDEADMVRDQFRKGDNFELLRGVVERKLTVFVLCPLCGSAVEVHRTESGTEVKSCRCGWASAGVPTEKGC